MPRQKQKNLWFTRLSIVSCIISLVAFLVILFQTSTDSKTVQASAYTPQSKSSFSTNKQRVEAGIHPLVVNEKLSRAAQNQS